MVKQSKLVKPSELSSFPYISTRSSVLRELEKRSIGKRLVPRGTYGEISSALNLGYDYVKDVANSVGWTTQVKEGLDGENY